jgi:hypothetical protein
MKRAIFFVLLGYISLISFSQNLVLNAGFEVWEKSNKPAGWTTAQNCLKDSINTKSGKYSCRHEGGTKYLGQTFPIVPDKQYRLTFYFKTIITGSGNGCRIWCYWKNSEGTNLTDLPTDDILRPSKYLKSDTWQQFSVDITAPANSASFYLEVRTYQNSISFFDDFVFEENVATYTMEEELSDIKIYPIPASDYLNISNVSGLKQLSIQSLSGKIISSSGFNGEQTVRIPVSGLPDGFYILRIKTAKGIAIMKFIKEKN